MAVLDPTRPIQVGLKQSVCAQSRPTLCSPMEACEAPLSMGFSRQEYWYGLSDPPIVVLPDPGVESSSLASSALVGGFFTTSATWEAWVRGLQLPKLCGNRWNICEFLLMTSKNSWTYLEDVSYYKSPGERTSETQVIQITITYGIKVPSILKHNYRERITEVAKMEAMMFSIENQVRFLS